MAKARLVITAAVVEGRSQSEVARECGVSQGWISRLVARYRDEGEAAFERTRTTNPPADHPAHNHDGPEPHEVQGHSDVLRHHMARSEGFEPPTF